MTDKQSERKAEILKSLKQYGDPDVVCPVLPLNVFLEYAGEESIGVNLPCFPCHERIFERLRQIEKRDDVEEILVRITDTVETNWFYTDTVYVIGTVSKEILVELMKPTEPNYDFSPDEVFDGWFGNKPPVNLSREIPIEKVHGLWWD